MDYVRVSDLIFVAHGRLVHPVALHAERPTIALRAGHARLAHLKRVKCKYKSLSVQEMRYFC